MTLSSDFYTKPVVGTNAAAIGSIGALALIGLVLDTNPSARLSWLACCLTFVASACLIRRTQFGKRDFVETVKGMCSKLFNSQPSQPEPDFSKVL